ncbi:MAG: hypothetical protein FWG21_07455 [Oscillospiraceae bacterium]|nr:hypothetical protein [Oscillospiraceae bacterium]
MDSTENKRLIPIPGVPVDMLNLPKGCAFAARCESCMKICLKRSPPKVKISEDHYSSCWLSYKSSIEMTGEGHPHE